MPVKHPSSEELGGFLANSLNDADRLSIERHLVVCGECRAELVAVNRAIASAPGATKLRRSTLYVGGLAAAAAIAVAFWPRTDFRPESERAERASSEQIRADRVVLDVVSPASGGVLPLEGTQFVWRRNDGASYKITLTDASGRPFWSASTMDTTITLPSTVQLPPGEQYFWYVDALRPDGRSVTSGVQSFRTSR